MGRVITWAGAGLLTFVTLIVTAVTATIAVITGAGAPTAECAATASGPAGLTSEQACNAATIIHVGKSMQVPRRGWVIAVAVALQESRLRNLPGGDRDSVGLFQQRPSQGWGTPQQLRDPEHAARAFYTQLLRVPDWRRLPLADAAQAVQRSAYPQAYAKHQLRAARIVTACLAGKCHPTPSAWVRPATGPIVSGFRPPGRPDHHGIDIAARRGATVRAATAGIVTTVECDVSTGTCDQDGSPSVQGCGWLVAIRHPDDLTTLYCHMLRRPHVRVGQHVNPGQPIGLVGTSGNSSGPHLHFQVHRQDDTSDRGAIDPAAVLRAKGVPLRRRRAFARPTDRRSAPFIPGSSSTVRQDQPLVRSPFHSPHGQQNYPGRAHWPRKRKENQWLSSPSCRRSTDTR